MATKNSDTIEVSGIRKGEISFFIVGDTPFVSNSMPEKALQELLYPSKGRRKSGLLKHVPLQEYRNSIYQVSDPSAPTLAVIKSVGAKEALRGAALDLGGTSKAQVGRLTYIKHDWLPLYGIPELFMTVVRTAGMNKTPDIRTRAIFPRWALGVNFEFVEPILNHKTMATLFHAAGIMQGLGDGRPEKGKHNYGQFRLVNRDDPEFLDIVASGGRQAQLAALETPVLHDDTTKLLYNWFYNEVDRRGDDGMLEDTIDALRHLASTLTSNGDGDYESEETEVEWVKA